MRLTTARYYTPAGRSIQAKGIDPDTIIEQELPPELQGKDTSTQGEASLRGHLKNEGGGEEGGGSSAYVPEDKTKDLQLKAAIDLLHGVKVATNVKPKEVKPAGTRWRRGSGNNRQLDFRDKQISTERWHRRGAPF